MQREPPTQKDDDVRRDRNPETMPTTSTASIPHVYAHRWKILAVLCTSLIIVIVGNTVLNVALPTLQLPPEQGGLGATNTEVQWIVDAYGLVFAGLLFTGRRARRPLRAQGRPAGGSRRVRRRVGAAAPSPTDPSMLIVARAIMGVGAAFVMPSTLSILTNVFPARERAKAIAIWAGISGSGAALGPLASGLLLEHFWWGSVFLINLPIIAGALVAGYVLVPKSKDSTGTPLDPVGAVLSIVGLERARLRDHRSTQPRLGERRLVAVVRRRGHRALLFVLWEHAQPPPDARPAAVPEPALRGVVGWHHARVLRHVRAFFLLAQYLQGVLGYSPLEAAVRLLRSRRS